MHKIGEMDTFRLRQSLTAADGSALPPDRPGRLPEMAVPVRLLPGSLTPMLRGGSGLPLIDGRQAEGTIEMPLRRKRDAGGSAFFGGDGEEGGDFLVDVLAVACGAFDRGLVVLFESKDEFEGLLAMFTIVIVARHGDLQR
jgi:hypothetical protein